MMSCEEPLCSFTKCTNLFDNDIYNYKDKGRGSLQWKFIKNVCYHGFHLKRINDWIRSSKKCAKCIMMMRPELEFHSCSFTNCHGPYDRHNIIYDTKIHLDCGHMFHEFCLRNWIRNSKKCSKCVTKKPENFVELNSVVKSKRLFRNTNAESRTTKPPRDDAWSLLKNESKQLKREINNLKNKLKEERRINAVQRERIRKLTRKLNEKHGQLDMPGTARLEKLI